MSEAEDIATGIRLAGRLHTRIDSLGTVCAGTLRSGMLGTLESASKTTIRDVEELVRLANAAVESGAPSTTQSEALLTLRGAIDQSLARIDAVLYDVVSAAE